MFNVLDRMRLDVLCLLVVKRERMEIEKGKENVIFHCLVGMQRERKENGVVGVFYLDALFFFSIQIRKKMGGEMTLIRKFDPLFHSSTFI